MSDFLNEHHTSWCPGCGNFSIKASLVGALEELGFGNGDVVLVSGIGQAAKMPHYVKTSFFNGLHGRALPAAAAIKASNPRLAVIAEGGDGDMYGEGGNHLLHAIRRNPDIAILVHNNMVYGLTKGQASPTSPLGMITPVQVGGVQAEPLNPISFAIALDATFVARALSYDVEKTKEILKAAIRHPGLALVDIFQPCPSFNKTNTMKWYREHTYYLEEGYDPTDRKQAFARALEADKYPLGIFYRNDRRTSFERGLSAYAGESLALPDRPIRMNALKEVIAGFRD